VPKFRLFLAYHDGLTATWYQLVAVTWNIQFTIARRQNSRLGENQSSAFCWALFPISPQENKKASRLTGPSI
jgi:hypothetical protein